MTEITRQPEVSRTFVGIRRSLHHSELPAFFGEVLPAMQAWFAARGIQPASPPMAMWHAMDRETGIADAQAGCFVAGPVPVEGEVTLGTTEGGDTLVCTHVGPYSTVGSSWMRVYARAAELGRAPGAGYEIYRNDPTEVAEAELQTEIHLPLRP